VQVFKVLGAKEFLPARKVTIDIFGEICTVMPFACVNVIDAICGYNERNINETRLPIYLSYSPAGRSGFWLLRLQGCPQGVGGSG
jgi:hypothetical protein